VDNSVDEPDQQVPEKLMPQGFGDILPKKRAIYNLYKSVAY
jgi:hypothetical protein